MIAVTCWVVFLPVNGSCKNNKSKIELGQFGPNHGLSHLHLKPLDLFRLLNKCQKSEPMLLFFLKDGDIAFFYYHNPLLVRFLYAFTGRRLRERLPYVFSSSVNRGSYSSGHFI